MVSAEHRGDRQRIGIRPALDGTWGGIYQYSLSIIDAAEKLSLADFVLVADDASNPSLHSFRERGWRVVPTQRSAAPRSLLARALRRTRPAAASVRTVPTSEIRMRRDVGDWWREQGIGMMVYPAPTPLAFEAGTPYVMAVHDVQHRLQPDLLEVSHDGEWEQREYLYRNCGIHAAAVLVDSDAGKEQFLSFYTPYGVPASRVKVLPFSPAPYLSAPSAEDRARVAQKYSLPSRYLLYPAQFWPHKNHPRVIQALESIRLRHDLEIPIVFCGSCSGALRERQFALVRQMVHQCGLDAQVSFLGYVPDGDMGALYAGATGLVFPTLFGPTNIPPVEAWGYDCPVLTSDIDGIREQMGDAAVLIDPRSTSAIADGIRRLWCDESLRRRLVASGRARLALYTTAHFQERLSKILDEARTCTSTSQQ